MAKLKKILFGTGKVNPLPSFALLLLRISSGAMMVPHGWMKLSNFNTMAPTFPDPLHVGNTASLGLVVFADRYQVRAG